MVIDCLGIAFTYLADGQAGAFFETHQNIWIFI